MAPPLSASGPSGSDDRALRTATLSCGRPTIVLRTVKEARLEFRRQVVDIGFSERLRGGYIAAGIANLRNRLRADFAVGKD
jgi:hypothetical protein